MTKESQKTNTMTAEETARQNSFIELAKTLTAEIKYTWPPSDLLPDNIWMSNE